MPGSGPSVTQKRRRTDSHALDTTVSHTKAEQTLILAIREAARVIFLTRIRLFRSEDALRHGDCATITAVLRGPRVAQRLRRRETGKWIDREHVTDEPPRDRAVIGLVIVLIGVQEVLRMQLAEGAFRMVDQLPTE